MNPHGSAQGAKTTAQLQQAARDGFPVLIPGARENRGSGSAAPHASIPSARASVHAGSADAFDHARLEREREGGGAPSERAGLPQRSGRAWLGRWLGRGIDMLRSAPVVAPGDGRR